MPADCTHASALAASLLIQQGSVGMHGRLVDGEGYPRTDIDVYAVRTARHRIICESSVR